MKMHLITAGSAVACGRDVDNWQRVSIVDRVTCARCMKSSHYRMALAEESRDVRKAQQEVLDILAAAVWEEAKDRNYCKTFDEIAEVGEGALPVGLRFRKPTQTFVLTLEVEASDEDDAHEIVNDNGVEDYLVATTTKS